MHSFHRTTQAEGTDLDQSGQQSSEEQTQSAVKPTDTSVERANMANSVESKVAEDLPQSTAEQKDLQVQDISEKDQNTESISKLTNQKSPLLPSAEISSQVSADFCIPSAQSNFSVPLCGDASIPSTDSNPLSPFIPKKRSLEEERDVSDLIQFGDNPEPNDKGADTCVVPSSAGGEAMPSEEVQLMKEANQAIERERKLSNARQPSLESDQSAVV